VRPSTRYLAGKRYTKVPNVVAGEFSPRYNLTLLS
jgi:hypothetical protein